MARPPANSHLLSIGTAWLIVLILTTGCWEKSRPQSKRAAADAARQRELTTSKTLIKAVTTQLRDLPGQIPLQLSPPVVVLDATSSRDGRDVMATLGPAPGSEARTANHLTVPAGNVDFRRAKIEPGDLLKCYLLPDAATRQRLKETGELDPNVLTHEPVELRVTQVTGPHSLRIADQLRIPARTAIELGSRIDPLIVAEFQKVGYPADFVSRIVEQLGAAGRNTPEGTPLPAEIVPMLPGVAWPFRMEVWRITDDRMNAIRSSLNQYAQTGTPPLAWEPTPDAAALSQVVEQLNQWIRSRKRDASWTPTKLLESLQARQDENIAQPGAAFSKASLARPSFAEHDGRLLQEAIWLRDIGSWARGSSFDPIAQATDLFDWSVRNVSLSDDPVMVANRPWQTLLHGRGSAAQRAWVFIELCRQQRLVACVLELKQTDSDSPWLWCGVLHEKSLVLFDPQLGLPIPGKGAGSVATLSEVQTEEGLLRELDLRDAPYPITQTAANSAIANVVGDSLSLSWRAEELQKQFTAQDAMSLAVEADSLAAELAELPSVSTVRLWSEPMRLLSGRLELGRATRNAIAVSIRPFAWRPRLWKARMLHFRGALENPADIGRQQDALREPVNDHRAAGQLYMAPSVRPSDSKLQRVPKEKRTIYSQAKANASYWLGLLQYELGEYNSALIRLREAEGDQNSRRRLDGILYNQARALEALGKTKQAAELLEASNSPQRHGDRLRARSLAGGGHSKAAD